MSVYSMAPIYEFPSYHVTEILGGIDQAELLCDDPNAS
jgi:hypothetical protein